MNRNISDSIILITSSDPNRREKFGTGFVIHQDNRMSYVLTCAHVVEIVGGSERVRVSGHPARKVILGDRYGCDLAVLEVEDRLTELPPLKLGIVEEKGRNFTIFGFYTDNSKTCKLAVINGKLGKEGAIEHSITGDRTPTRVLKISADSENKLEEGYSGSPVIDAESSYVIWLILRDCY